MLPGVPPGHRGLPLPSRLSMPPVPAPGQLVTVRQRRCVVLGVRRSEVPPHVRSDLAESRARPCRQKGQARGTRYRLTTPDPRHQLLCSRPSPNAAKSAPPENASTRPSSASSQPSARSATRAKLTPIPSTGTPIRASGPCSNPARTRTVPGTASAHRTQTGAAAISPSPARSTSRTRA
jgi:hypothetical protein